MQCRELRYQKLPIIKTDHETKSIKNEKETIHSGQFMVSHFEAEAQDDEFEVAVPVPESKGPEIDAQQGRSKMVKAISSGQLAIDTSLAKLFQCMSLAYRQKLTSPKWNRFRGIRLRWKDKIRLNNVIWRCWHMQFIKRENTLICQFASPLDEGTHNKPEAVVLEGKYWKRRLAAVTAEYKRWRMFYRNRILGGGSKEGALTDMELFEWTVSSNENSQCDMMTDEDYMELMSDTLFSTISSNQPFAFPDSREIARSANLADFIQPSLVQLQPNLDDFMDTLEPLPDFFSNKLPTVPEEITLSDVSYREAALQHLNMQTITPTTQLQYSTNRTQNTKAQQNVFTPIKMEDYINYEQQQQQQSAIKTNRSYPKVRSPQRISPTPQFQQPIMAVMDNKVNQLFNEFVMNESSNYRRGGVPSPTQFLQTQPYDQPNVLKASGRSASLPSVDKQDEYFAVPKSYTLKPRNRTRSGSSLVASSNPRQHPPPLVSTSSDPAFNIPSNALLAQLLTNNTTVFNMGNQERPPTAQQTVKSTNVPILPMPPKLLPQQQQTTAFVITAPVTLTSSANQQPQGMLSNMRRVDSPPEPQTSTSPIVFTTGPLSPSTSHKNESPFRSPPGHSEHRRVCHINAEQKRRYNIRSGFDTLHSLIPHLHQNPNVKLSKAAMLQKGAEYIRQLQAERVQLKEEMESLKAQIDNLNTSISNCQQMLPATGAPVSRHRTTKMKEMFDEFVRIRTMENWKFWIFSVLFEPLLHSFNCSVSTASFEDLYRSTLIWVEQHCSLVDLRPAVLNSLRHLSTSTDILSDPSKLPEEARAAVHKTSTS